MLVLLVVLAAVVVYVIGGTTSDDSAGEFSATVSGYLPENPASLVVVVEVTNDGSEASVPTCSITADDPSGTYHGFDSFEMKRAVVPGETAKFRGSVTITNEGAQYVTEVTATCR